MTLSLAIALIDDYGIDVTTAVGTRNHLRSVCGASAARLLPINDEREYGRIVRRLHRHRIVEHPLAAQQLSTHEREFVGELTPQQLRAYHRTFRRRRGLPPLSASYVDGRLLAAGWCLSSPTRWAAELESWLTYYSAAVERPNRVGSDYHPLSPAQIAVARRIGVPAWTLRSISGTQGQLLNSLRLTDRLAATRSSDVAARRRATARLPRRTITRFRRIGRAIGRTSAKRAAEAGRQLCGAAWAALGRVSPEVQRAILEHLAAHPPEGAGPLRIRDLPWAVGGRAARDMACSPVARAAWATGRRRAALAAALTAQEQRRVAHPLGALLARGLTPAVAVDRFARSMEGYEAEAPRLTAREAHEYVAAALANDFDGPAEWLLAQAPHVSVRVACQGDLPRGAIGVARWLCAVAAHAPRRESLRRIRRVQHPHTGEVYEAALSSQIDEIRWLDIAAAGGLHAGVEAVFEAASRRLAALVTEGWEQDERVLCNAPAWLSPVPGVALITTPALLVEEGLHLGHCVGTYVPRVARGESLIVSIRTPDGECSTAELSRGAVVRQHRGPVNSEPPRRHRELLAAAIVGSAP